MIGSLEQTTDGWALRFVRPLRHSPEQVWAALTEPDRLAAWFPDTLRGEIAVGNTLTFGTTYESVPDFTGTVLTVDPPRLLEFTWGEDTLRFEIEPTDDGCTLTVRDSIAALGKAARDGAGWHVCLDRLGDALDALDAIYDRDRSDGHDTSTARAVDRWNVVYAEYLAAFPPEAATIGVPAQALDTSG